MDDDTEGIGLYAQGMQEEIKRSWQELKLKLLREELEQTKQELVQVKGSPAQIAGTHLGTWNWKHDGAHKTSLPGLCNHTPRPEG